MLKPRIVLAVVLLGLLSPSVLLAVTINVRAKFKKAPFNAWENPLHIYVNGRMIGAIGDGEDATFRCDNARLGRNEVYVKMGWLLVPRIEINFYDISDNKKTSKKYFLVRRSGEEIAVELGFRPPNVSSYFNVSSEINADAAKISRVELDRTLKAITLKESPPIQLAPNTEKFVEDSMTLSHEVKTSTTWTVGADLKAQVNAAWAAVTVGILGKLESVTSSDYSVETKRTRSVTIKGGSPPVKVVWVEYFRTGTAIVAINGREVRVPFEIDEDFDLVTEPAR